MFGSIGITELLLIAGIALIFLGPEKFPEFAKIVARTVRDIRGYVQEAQTEITKDLKPVQDELNKIQNEDADSYFERLADLAENDDDTEIQPEPDPTDWYEMDQAGEANSPEGAVPYETTPDEMDSEEEPARKETLDG